MFRRFAVDFALLSVFVDVILVVLCLILATILRPRLNTPPYIKEISGIQTFPIGLYLFRFRGI
jgi:hypothetical protein